jgi:hypothetical protein
MICSSCRMEMCRQRLRNGNRDIPAGSGSGPIRAGAYDPSATLAVHCGNGFDGGFSPYQSARLRR